MKRAHCGRQILGHEHKIAGVGRGPLYPVMNAVRVGVSLARVGEGPGVAPGGRVIDGFEHARVLGRVVDEIEIAAQERRRGAKPRLEGRAAVPRLTLVGLMATGLAV